MKERESSPLGFYMLGISALFLAGFLLLVVLGAMTYRNTAAGQEQNNQTRSLLAYLSVMVRANDAEGAVYIAETAGPEDSEVLVIGDGSGYAARIYRYQGYLVEDYGEEKGDFLPDEALKIGKTQEFALIPGPGGGLTARTDEGSVFLSLRSRGGIADLHGEAPETGTGEADTGAGQTESEGGAAE